MRKEVRGARTPVFLLQLAADSLERAQADASQELGPYQAFLDELILCMVPPRQYQPSDAICNEVGDERERRSMEWEEGGGGKEMEH